MLAFQFINRNIRRRWCYVPIDAVLNLNSGYHRPAGCLLLKRKLVGVLSASAATHVCYFSSVSPCNMMLHSCAVSFLVINSFGTAWAWGCGVVLVIP